VVFDADGEWGGVTSGVKTAESLPTDMKNPVNSGKIVTSATSVTGPFVRHGI
jgi:hypothetical protein